MSLTIPLLSRPWKWRTDSLLWREVAAGDSCFRAFQHLLSVHPSPITRCAGLSTRPGVGAQLPHSQWVCVCLAHGSVPAGAKDSTCLRADTPKYLWSEMEFSSLLASSVC